MSIAAAIVAGGALGLRHAFEADHVAAVMTLIDDERRLSTCAGIGTSWGIGHCLPISILGLSFVLLGIRLPDRLTQLFEAGVGVVLVYLGLRLLVTVIDTTRHVHGDHPAHTHLRIGANSLGLSHRHLDGASFVVGVLHGLAGTGALVIVLVASAPGVSTAVAFLAAFSGLAITTMAAVSVMWGRTLGTRRAKYLKLVAGFVGIGVGVRLLAAHAGGVGVI